MCLKIHAVIKITNVDHDFFNKNTLYYIGASIQPSPAGDGTSLASVTIKDALKKQEWLDTQLHKLKVQLYMKKSGNIMLKINVPVHEKTNKLGSDQVRHKPGCTVTEDG